MAAEAHSHPGVQICAIATFTLFWLVWALFCIVMIENQHAALTTGALGVAVLLVLILGAAMMPVWALHVACTLSKRRLFRPKRVVTALSSAAGVAGFLGALHAPALSSDTRLAAALTAGTAVASAALDLLFLARAWHQGRGEAAKPLLVAEV